MSDQVTYEIGDIVSDAAGQHYLVAWTNVLRDGSMAPTVPVLVLDDEGNDKACIDIDVATIAQVEQKAAFSFEETRKRFWTFLADHMN